jgi:hypothetical protein
MEMSLPEVWSVQHDASLPALSGKTSTGFLEGKAGDFPGWKIKAARGP